jgi:hypothetical protein
MLCLRIWSVWRNPPAFRCSRRTRGNRIPATRERSRCWSQGHGNHVLLLAFIMIRFSFFLRTQKQCTILCILCSCFLLLYYFSRLAIHHCTVLPRKATEALYLCYWSGLTTRYLLVWLQPITVSLWVYLFSVFIRTIFEESLRIFFYMKTTCTAGHTRMRDICIL